MLEGKRADHIPSTMEQAVAYNGNLIEEHYAAMRAGDKDAAIVKQQVA
jgi:hypothetical protein